MCLPPISNFFGVNRSFSDKLKCDSIKSLFFVIWVRFISNDPLLAVWGFSSHSFRLMLLLLVDDEHLALVWGDQECFLNFSTIMHFGVKTRSCNRLVNFLHLKIVTFANWIQPVVVKFSLNLNFNIYLRRQSCVVAVQNARAKGLEIANSLGQTLGPARFIQELSTEEFNEMEIRSNNVNGRKTFQEMLKSSALTFVTKVFAVFVLKVKKTSLKK